MVEKNTSSYQLRYKYQQNGVCEKMSLTFNQKNLLRPIINIGGSIFEGSIVSTTSYRHSDGNSKRIVKLLKVEFINDRLPNGVKDRIISFDLAEYLPITIGLLGISTQLIKPILGSEQTKVKMNGLNNNKRSKLPLTELFNEEDTRLRIFFYKDNGFSRKDKTILKKLIKLSK